MPNLPAHRTVLLAAAGCLIPGLFAQQVPDGGTRERLVSIFIPPLPGHPFTGTVNTEWVRFLGDGSRITLRNHRLIARDKNGRIFQERRLLVPLDGGPESALTQTEITDPLLGERYICMPRELVCQLELFQPMTPSAQATKSGPQSDEVPLGIKMMAGLEAVGTRETVTVPAGAMGNSSPILTKREFWYSRQLGMNTLSIREDPRFGTQKFELSDIVMAEPDAALFAPPAGSKIVDLRSLTAK